MFEDREDIMRHWDRWAEYYRNGGRGSWPRDAFESLIEYFYEEIERLKQMRRNE